jgi:hypothetical protein
MLMSRAIYEIMLMKYSVYFMGIQLLSNPMSCNLSGPNTQMSPCPHKVVGYLCLYSENQEVYKKAPPSLEYYHALFSSISKNKHMF